jgi:uncharacterized protein YjgD (DUF1641 family)
LSGEAQLTLTEEEVKALKEFVEIVVNLKRAGLLDFLKFLSEKAEDATVLLSYSPGLFRALALADGALEAIEKAEPNDIIEAKKLMINVTNCSLKAMAKAASEKPRRVGLGGLLSALRDPDVQTGLGLLIAIAKQLGSCIRSQTG